MSRTRRLQALWKELNDEHFEGALTPVPIRITRSRRTYGYFHGPNNGGRASIRISTVLADTSELLRETLVHEMIHQKLYERRISYWNEHGGVFQAEHVRIFGVPYEEPV